MSNICVPPMLLTWHDLQGFFEVDTRIQSGTGLSGGEQRRLMHQLVPLREQAAWLLVEELFAQNPDVVAVRVVNDADVDEEGSALIELQRQGEEDFSGYGEDPERLDESFQEYLNNVVRDPQLRVAMGEADLTRESWVTQAQAWLGNEWAVARERHMIEQTVPARTTPKLPNTRI